MVQSFDPIARDDAKVLILGTLPGPESVRLRRYYANPANAFWSIIERLFGIDRSSGGRLVERGIALWDVLERAERNGSSDGSIRKRSEKVNDFEVFFREHTSIQAVFFNGRRAERYFRRLALPSLTPEVRNRIRCHPALPSSSPANTHATREAKAKAWHAVKLVVENS